MNPSSDLRSVKPRGVILVEWLAKDRCLVTFADGKEVKTKRKALERIVREWVGQM
ncbi:MAG: hypothetical protein L0Y58_25380 [Verrucomicrobia subdivision 3 bacterium]|nr:hypothetical protein [Limisphaerales bacterium]